MRRRAIRDASWPSRRRTCCSPTRSAVATGMPVTRPVPSAQARAPPEVVEERRPDAGHVRTRAPALDAHHGLPGADQRGTKAHRGHRAEVPMAGHATTTLRTTPRKIRMNLARVHIAGAHRGGIPARAATPGAQKVCPGGRTSQVRGERHRVPGEPLLVQGERPLVRAKRPVETTRLVARADRVTQTSTAAPAVRPGPARRGATSDRATAICPAVACSGERVRSTSRARVPARRLMPRRRRPRMGSRLQTR